MLCIAFGIVMVLSLCAQSQSSAVDGLSLHVNGKFDELVHEVDHLKEVIEGMKQCHVDVNVIADEDAHSQGDHAVDINLHVKEDHHDDEHDDDDHEEVHDDNDYYGNVYCKACADTHQTMNGVIHMEHLKEYEHLEFVVVVHDAQPNTEYTVKVYDHGHKDDHCDFRASELFDPEKTADHKGELGKFTTDGQGQAHVYIKDTHFSLRGGRGNSIYGHIVSIDTPAHTYECHGVAGHSTTKEEYHEFVQHHKEKEFDFDQDDVYAVCHLHSGEHDGHVTGVRGDVHFAQHIYGDHDMQIRVDITGAKPNTHYTLVEYMHGDTGHKCIDMGEKYDTVHHEKHDYGFTTDVYGAAHAIFYNANNTLLSHSSDYNVAGYAFAINDDAGHHEACCVAGIATYNEEHHYFKHERAHYEKNDSFAIAHMRVHESDFDSQVTGEVHIMQHYTEENKAEVRIDLEHLRGKNYERLQLYIDDHEHAAEIHDCPPFTDLKGGLSHYIGDFHTKQGHDVEHYGFRGVPITLKGTDSVVGSVIVVYDGTDDAHHALVCGIIEKSDYDEEQHFETAHAKDDVHYI